MLCDMLQAMLHFPCSWLSSVTRQHSAHASSLQVVPDGFIYLRAKPETCLTRLGRRSRSEETGVRSHHFSS